MRLRLARLPRAGIAVAALASYFVFFHAVYGVVGPATGAFYFSVVAVIGWLFGVRGGILGALAALPMASVTYALVQEPGTGVTLAGQFGAVAANLIMGFVSGRWSDLNVNHYHQRLQLRHTERRHRMAVAATRDVIWEYDFKSKSVWYSKEFRELTKYEESQQPASFEAWLQIVHAEDRDRFAAEWTAAVEQGARGSSAYRLIRADGTTIPVVDRFLIERDGQGRPEFAVGALADVSEQQKTLDQAQSLRDAAGRERNLNQMSEFKSQLLNMASHELNTPISAMRIQLFLLKQQLGETPNPDVARCFNVLDRNTARLARLVADTLDVARIQNGRLSLRAEPCRISTVVEETLSAYMPVAQERQLRIATEIQADPPVEADASRLTQVLFNLVSNAIKFAKSEIRVGVRADSSTITISVADDGMGIPTVLQDRLFKPFSQLHESSTAANKGNGLGLYISRNIVELHGGTLSCSSAGEGQGSVFEFQLPLRHSSVVLDRAQVPAIAALP